MKTFVRVAGQNLPVKWNFVDKAIAFFNPAAGTSRLKHRTVMAASIEGGYTGGKRDRRPTRNWRPTQRNANLDIGPDLPDLRSRSRDLARNVPIATGALNTVVTNVVGDGLILQA